MWSAKAGDDVPVVDYFRSIVSMDCSNLVSHWQEKSESIVLLSGNNRAKYISSPALPSRDLFLALVMMFFVLYYL